MRALRRPVGYTVTLLVLACLISMPGVRAQQWPQEWPKAPQRPQSEGEGPFKRLIIQGAMLVDGRGAPPRGPVTIVIEANRIVSVGGGGPRQAAAGEKVIDAKGMYVLPGFIDTHVRLNAGGNPLEYVMKLMLAHGVTTIASMQDPDHVDWALGLHKESTANTITAPRVRVWVDAGRAATPDEMRARIREFAKRGVTGFGEGSFGGSLDVVKAGLDEATKLGLPSTWHMNYLNLQQFNALDAARAGLKGLSHWYGLPEALFENSGLQNYPAGYNFSDVRDRFRQSGRLWKTVAKPHSAHWNKVMDEFLKLGFTFEPTFSVYEANRDYSTVAYAEWHDDYLHPSMEKAFTTSLTGSFTHFYNWTSTDEAEWKRNFHLWMTFVNEYKNRGGRVIAGTDPGYMWANFGFEYIRNLELLQEAGFTPLEVVSAATLNSAEHLRMDADIGSIEPGKLADLVIVDGNPMDNLKVFYGTGILDFDDKGVLVRKSGVKYTVKDGIVFDAKTLLADVRRMVKEARSKQGRASSSAR